MAFRALGLIALSTPLLACSGKGTAGQGAHDDPVEVGRVPALVGQPLGTGPGHLEGAMISGAVRAGPAAAVFQSLPMPPDLVRDLAELGAEIGGDLRIGDLPGRFGVAPDAMITFSVGRPLDGPVGDLRRTLEAPPPWLGALAEHDRANERRRELGLPTVPLPDRGDDTRPAIAVDPTPPAARVEAPAAAPGESPSQRPPSPPSQVPPATPGWTPPPPQVEGPAPADLARAARFSNRASTLAYHSRFHVPTTRPTWLRELALRQGWDPQRGRDEKSVCAEFSAPTDLCSTSGDTVFVARAHQDGLTIDVVVFERYPEAWTPEHDAIAIDAVRTSSIPNARVAAMHGDAGAYADGAAIARAFTMHRIGRAAGSLRWDGQPSLRRLHAAERIRADGRVYAGATLELSLDPDAIVARGTWVPLDPKAAARAETLLERPQGAAPVPTIEGLCAGSIACFRATGLPGFANASSVLQGFWGAPLETIIDGLDDGDELAALSVLLESWPTFLAALMTQPVGGREVGAQMAAGLIRESATRITGYGGSLRSLSVGRRSAAIDFALYARATGADLASLRGVSAMVGDELRLAPVKVQGVDGRVDAMTVRDADVPATLYLMAPTGPAGEQPTTPAWAVLADADDRVRWLQDLPTDDGERPAAYAEIPDLWRVFSAERHAERELGFASSWLQTRELRVQIDRVGGAPLVRAVVRTRR